MSGAHGEITLGGYRPGALGWAVETQAAYYGRHWGFGVYFEAKIAAELAEFLLRYDEKRDLFRLALAGDDILGTISVDGSDAAGKGAHLRWFMVDPAAQGRGVGRRLLDAGLGFCGARGYSQIYLWTFAGLDAARRLYDDAGFQVVEEQEDDQWGKTMREQRMVLQL